MLQNWAPAFAGVTVRMIQNCVLGFISVMVPPIQKNCASTFTGVTVG
jgi:hypothetical protein